MLCFSKRGVLLENVVLTNEEIYEITCLSCAMNLDIDVLKKGCNIETTHFYAHQELVYPVKGLIVVVSKRHFKGLDELTEEEQLDYIQLLSNIRKVQRKLLKVESVYYFYQEDTTHHFHVWLMPRYKWMDRIGRSVESIRPILSEVLQNYSSEIQRDEALETAERLAKSLQRMYRKK